MAPLFQPDGVSAPKQHEGATQNHQLLHLELRFAIRFITALYSQSTVPEGSIARHRTL